MTSYNHSLSLVEFYYIDQDLFCRNHLNDRTVMQTVGVAICHYFYSKTKVHQHIFFHSSHVQTLTVVITELVLAFLNRQQHCI